MSTDSRTRAAKLRAKAESTDFPAEREVLLAKADEVAANELDPSYCVVCRRQIAAGDAIGTVTPDGVAYSHVTCD